MSNPRKCLETGETLIAFGYKLDQKGIPIRGLLDTLPGDYGHDPIGNGMFRMVPSGDIVTLDELMSRKAKRERDAS